MSNKSIGTNPRLHTFSKGSDGAVWFASEAKALVAGGCISIENFPPGHYWSSKENGSLGGFVRYYNPDWISAENAVTKLDLSAVRRQLVNAVEKRLMADVPYGVFLSGGLDSSLVASIMARVRRERFLIHGHTSDLQPVRSFSIGLEGSPDLAAAQKVADFIGTDHYGYTFTVQEGIDAVADVIYHLETYDVTTIRAGTPMFLLARKVKSMGIKMVMSGEGADETLAGYLYFHKAPNGTELHEECVRKVRRRGLHTCQPQPAVRRPPTPAVRAPAGGSSSHFRLPASQQGHHGTRPGSSSSVPG